MLKQEGKVKEAKFSQKNKPQMVKLRWHRKQLGKVSGLLGFRYYLRRDLFLSLGVSYDNNDAFLIRPGVTYWFH